MKLRLASIILVGLLAVGVVWVYRVTRSSQPDPTTADALARSDTPQPEDTEAPMDTAAPTNPPEPTDTVTVEPTHAPMQTDTPAPSDAPASTEKPAPTAGATDTPPLPDPPALSPDEALAAPIARELEIVTLLPKDAIPSIDDPQFLAVPEADEVYDPDELVLGVEIDGDARAYSIPNLSRHEIVNDEVGGRKIAVTW